MLIVQSDTFFFQTELNLNNSNICGEVKLSRVFYFVHENRTYLLLKCQYGSLFYIVHRGKASLVHCLYKFGAIQLTIIAYDQFSFSNVILGAEKSQDLHLADNIHKM